MHEGAHQHALVLAVVAMHCVHVDAVVLKLNMILWLHGTWHRDPLALSQIASPLLRCLGTALAPVVHGGLRLVSTDLLLQVMFCPDVAYKAGPGRTQK